jgi:hypothetical protein
MLPLGGHEEVTEAKIDVVKRVVSNLLGVVS